MSDLSNRRPALEQFAEWSVAKIAARYVVPVLFGFAVYVGQQYLEAQNKKIEQQGEHLDAVDQRSVTAASHITETLSDIQKSIATQQATQQLQYNQLQQQNDSQDRRLDRFEDRLNGRTSPR